MQMDYCDFAGAAAVEILADTADSASEEPLYTDYTVTTLTVTEAGNYWLTGYDAINKVAGTAYPNAKKIDASECAGTVVLVGNYLNNSLIAGEGKSSLWGGVGGNDAMYGGSSRDMFWYGEGDGNDVAYDFTAGTGDAADVLNLYSGGLQSVSRSGNVLKLAMADGNGLSVRISSGTDAAVLYTFGAKDSLRGAMIGDSTKANSMRYDDSVTYYQGGSGRDVLTLDGGTEAKVVWLDGSKGKSFSGIDVIDGSESSGADQLAGAAASESLYGGRANTSLWGGPGSASDTLRAGTGGNFLYYGYGEGNDVMEDTHWNDTVMLYNVSLSQLTGAAISSDAVSITTTAGQTLTVNGKAGEFDLAGDGTRWKPNRLTCKWEKL